MQKRIIRLGTQAQIRQQLNGLPGKKINIVQNDNTVMLVQVLNTSETTIVALNMRGQKLTVNLNDIYEIIIDINA